MTIVKTISLRVSNGTIPCIYLWSRAAESDLNRQLNTEVLYAYRHSVVLTPSETAAHS